MLGRRSGIALTVIVLLVLAMFLVSGMLDPPSRLRTRPNTATPQPTKPAPTVVKALGDGSAPRS